MFELLLTDAVIQRLQTQTPYRGSDSERTKSSNAQVNEEVRASGPCSALCTRSIHDGHLGM